MKGAIAMIAFAVALLMLLGCAHTPQNHPEREVPFGGYSFGDIQEGGTTK